MTSIQWTTPVRMSGTTMLQPVPNEIYLEIFDYFETSDTMFPPECRRILARLALVCRLFCSIALPRIFASLDIFGAPAKETEDLPPNNAKFCSAIVRKQEPAATLAGYVKECNFMDWSNKEDWANAGFLKMYGQAMTRMSNLEKLSFMVVDIDRHLLKTICGLKRLTSLSFFLCTFSKDIDDASINKLPPLKLKVFSFTGSNGNPKLFQRIIDTTDLVEFRSTQWDITEKILVKFEEDSPLESLDLFQAIDEPVLWRAIERTKKLKTILLASLSLHDGKLPAIPSPSLVPELRRLRAPPLLVSLVPGRPLNHVSLTGSLLNRDGSTTNIPRMKVSDIDKLVQSSGDVRVLSVPSHLYFVAPWGGKLESLEELRLAFGHKNYPDYLEDEPAFKQMMKEVVAHSLKYPPPASLRKLHLDIGHADYWGDLELQHSVLDSILGAFPNLLCITFFVAIQWHRDPAKGTWHGLVPPAELNTVQALLKVTPEEMIKDYDGILTSIPLEGLLPA